MKSFERSASSPVNRDKPRRLVVLAVLLATVACLPLFSEEDPPEAPAVTALAPTDAAVSAKSTSAAQEEKTVVLPASSADRQEPTLEPSPSAYPFATVPNASSPAPAEAVSRAPLMDRRERETADRRVLEKLARTKTLVPRYQMPVTLLAPEVRKRLSQERAFRDAVIGVALEFNRSVEINASDRLELGLYREQSMRADTELPIIYKRLSVPKHETLSRERIEAIKANEHLGACDAFGDLFEQGYIMVYEVYFKNPYRPPMYFKMDRESCRKYEERHLELPPLDELEASLHVPSSGF